MITIKKSPSHGSEMAISLYRLGRKYRVLMGDERVVFGVVLFLFAWLSNFRSLVTRNLHPVHHSFSYQAWLELVYWLLATLLVFWLLVRSGNLAKYFRNWSKQPLLVGFLAICTATVFWSVAPIATLFHVIVLSCATSIAAYIGMRCKLNELLQYLSWFGAVVVFASIYLALVDPPNGMQTFYGPDVWRGIFWHKNHLGSVTAFFSAVLLLHILDVRARATKVTTIVLVLIYAGTLLAIYKSHSAGGYLVATILHITVIMSLLWIRFAKFLRWRDYVLLAIAVLSIVGILLVNLDIVFSTFGKNTTLTGRTNLWAYLLEAVVSNRPFLGYGIGSLWGDDQFRSQIHEMIGWYQPVIGDNGFIDILLGVGLVGLVVIAANFVVAWRGAIRYLLAEKNVSSCLPLLIMSFAVFSNISFSLLIEIEVLVWGLMVVALFATSKETHFVNVPTGTPQ